MVFRDCLLLTWQKRDDGEHLGLSDISRLSLAPTLRGSLVAQAQRRHTIRGLACYIGSLLSLIQLLLSGGKADLVITLTRALPFEAEAECRGVSSASPS